MSDGLAQQIAIVKGDITGLDVDAIVNAANTSLLGGGGVDGRIHYVAGPELLAECRTLEGCPTGSARITRGYRLKAGHIIHAVGPVYRDGRSGEPELLAGCYRTALWLAVEHGCKSIAFPAISCGAYRYPLEAAARIAFREVMGFLPGHPQLERVVFALYDEPAYKTYQDLHATLLTVRKEGSK